MAISLEASFPIVNVSSSFRTSFSQSITVGSGTNRIIVVAVVRDRVDTSSGANTVAFNTSETLADCGAGWIHPTQWSSVQFFYRVAPSNTTANVDVTCPNAGSTYCGAAIWVLDGVHQTVPLRTSTPSNHADTGAFSGSAISDFAAGDYALSILSIDSTGHSPAVTGNNVSDFSTQNFGTGSDEWQGSHNTTDGTLGWSWSTTTSPWSWLALALVPDTYTPSVVPHIRVVSAGRRGV